MFIHCMKPAFMNIKDLRPSLERDVVHDFDDESSQFVEFLSVAFIHMRATTTPNLPVTSQLIVTHFLI